MTSQKKQLSQKKQFGFTLLELIVTLSVLGVMTSLATDFFVNESNQKRFELSKKRVETIRYAIVGDDSRNLNSQVSISGFVTETGELPTELRQLLVKSYCDEPTYFTSSDCTLASGTWITQTNWQGPYLRPTGTESITDGAGNDRVVSVYRDAWGTKNSVQDEDLRNFGWNFNRIEWDTTATPPEWNDNDAGLNLKVQSLGLNQETGTSSSNSDDARYEADYPVLDVSDENSYPLIVESDYETNDAFSVSILNSSGAPIDVCLTWSGASSGNSGVIPISNAGSWSTSTPTSPPIVLGSVMGKIYFSIKQDLNANSICDDVNLSNVSYSSSSVVVAHRSITNSDLTITISP